MSALGHWDIPGDPAAVLAVADRLGTIAESTAEIARQVASGNLDGSWEGPAAERFEALKRDLPTDIKKISEAHETARSALSIFGHQLQGLKAEARALAGQLDAARAEGNAAAARHKSAQKATLSAQTQHGTTLLDPVAHHTAGQQLAAAKRELNDASSAKARASSSVGSLQRQAEALRASYEAAARSATETVNHACALSRGDRWDAGYARYVEGTVIDTALDAIVAPFKAIAKLPEAIGRFSDDPSWTNARALIDVVVGIVTVVAIVVAVAGLPLALAMAGAAIGVAAVKVAVTGAAVATEGLDSKELAYDAVGLGLSVVPFRGIRGKMSAAKSPGARTHYKRYGKSYNPKPLKAVVKDVAGKRVDRGIAHVLVDLEFEAAQMLLGPLPQAPTIFTPKARETTPLSLLFTPNATVRHHIPLVGSSPQQVAA